MNVGAIGRKIVTTGMITAAAVAPTAARADGGAIFNSGKQVVTATNSLVGSATKAVKNIANVNSVSKVITSGVKPGGDSCYGPGVRYKVTRYPNFDSCAARTNGTVVAEGTNTLISTSSEAGNFAHWNFGSITNIKPWVILSLDVIQTNAPGKVSNVVTNAATVVDKTNLPTAFYRVFR